MITSPSNFAEEADSYQPVSRQPPDEAYQAVLQLAGAFPRDVMTLETIDDIRTGGGDWTPDPPVDLLAGLTASEPPADEDEDGMADDWEVEHGLDPANGNDHATVLSSGYTAIEVYVNGLADDLVGRPAPAGEVQPPTETSGPTSVTPPSSTDASTSDLLDDDDDATRLASVAIVLSGVAVVVAVVALFVARRRRPPPT